MKLAHYLAARVLSLPSDIERNSDALRALLSSGNAGRDIPVTVHQGDGSSQSALLTSFLRKESEINRLLRFIASGISEEEKKTIITEAEQRVDDRLDFFLRFDREPWLTERKLVLTTKGDCFHLTFSMAAYPKSRERAIALVKQVFSSLQERHQ